MARTTTQRIIAAHNLETSKRPDFWAKRHAETYRRARADSAHPMHGFLLTLEGWAAMADNHRQANESGIAVDGYGAPLWAEIGKCLRGWLNFELHGMDGGTLDGIIFEIAKAEGFDPDTW